MLSCTQTCDVTGDVITAEASLHVLHGSWIGRSFVVAVCASSAARKSALRNTLRVSNVTLTLTMRVNVKDVDFPVRTPRHDFGCNVQLIVWWHHACRGLSRAHNLELQQMLDSSNLTWCRR